MHGLESGPPLKSSQQEDGISVSLPAVERPPKFSGLWRLALGHLQIDLFIRAFRYCNCFNVSDFAQNGLMYKHKLQNFYTNVLQNVLNYNCRFGINGKYKGLLFLSLTILFYRKKICIKQNSLFHTVSASICGTTRVKKIYILLRSTRTIFWLL